MHGFTLGVIAAQKHVLIDSTNDLYGSLVSREHMDIKTHYEKIFLERNMAITYLLFSLK